ncbi:hypothetical protein LSM04_005897 [Trypanosoma melophagium]|uniref:uncharacterized protein n=1 Tax=Trypanosoma melophagium TaxID=715481 RepID=UPI00351A4943|nr:hypothetical protein LSM04_005897 [Trypanosoma melophagium]
MSMQGVVAMQLLRQSTLQPRLKLPAGRIVSLEEGRRLARLINEEAKHNDTALTGALENKSVNSPVVLEEQVSKRILLLRQKNNKAANVKAAVAYAQRSKVSNKMVETGAEVRDIAVKLLKKDKGNRSALKERHERSKGEKSGKKR